MSIDVGDVWEPILTVRDRDGNLTDVTATYTVTDPDGNVSADQIPTHVSLGVYRGAVSISSLGRWYTKWTVTGDVTGVETTQIDVQDPTTRLVSLDEVKQHLNITRDDDDEELQFFIDAASEWITKVVSDTSPSPVRLGVLELVRHLWDTQRGPMTNTFTGDDFTLGLAGFSIPNRVLELLGPWLLPGYQAGAKNQATPLGSFPDPSPRCWPDPVDSVWVNW